MGTKKSYLKWRDHSWLRGKKIFEGDTIKFSGNPLEWKAFKDKDRDWCVRYEWEELVKGKMKKFKVEQGLREDNWKRWRWDLKINFWKWRVNTWFKIACWIKNQALRLATWESVRRKTPYAVGGTIGWRIFVWFNRFLSVC